MQRILLSVLLVCLTAGQLKAETGRNYFVYFGTYTGFKYVHHGEPLGVGDSHSKGIYVSRFDAKTGELKLAELAAEIVNPSFLAVHPNHRFLYAVAEDPQSLGPAHDHASYVSAYAIEPKSGKLRLLNTLPTGGTSTCFLSIDETGRFVFFANFGSGSVSVLRIKEDGSLGEMTAFLQELGHGSVLPLQAGPHPHSIVASPDNRHVIVSDLGLDKVFVYNFDAETGRLSPPEAPSVALDPGSAPRHFTFDPSGRFAYQLTELGSFVAAFTWDAQQGTLTRFQTQTTIPADFKGQSHSAEIQVSRDGKFLYESNRRTITEFKRGPESIGVFAIDPATGGLTAVQDIATGGQMPRSFSLDPTNAWLLAANEWTNNIAIFSVDRSSGKLTNTGRTIEVDTPVCVQFVPE